MFFDVFAVMVAPFPSQPRVNIPLQYLRFEDLYEGLDVF